MNENPYASPAAAVVDVVAVDAAPKLWNPNAAANWSLLFSPAFGALLHMKNWQALGDLQRAQANRNWAIASVVIILGSALLAVFNPDSKALDGSTRLVGLGLLIAWYLGSAKAQAQLVKERFGSRYPRRGWTLPLLVALGCFAALVVGASVLFLVTGP